jgi:hypothetical protein
MSYGASFFHYYIGRREYRSTSAWELFHAPFRRIIPVQAALFLLALGGFLSALTDGVILLLLVITKTGFDLFMHLYTHGRLGHTKTAR